MRACSRGRGRWELGRSAALVELVVAMQAARLVRHAARHARLLVREEILDRERERADIGVAVVLILLEALEDDAIRGRRQADLGVGLRRRIGGMLELCRDEASRALRVGE